MALPRKIRRIVQGAMALAVFLAFMTAMGVGIFLTQQEQDLWSKAYKKDILVQTFCSDTGTVNIEVTYTNVQEGRPSPLTVNVQVTDNETGVTGTLNEIPTGETKTLTLETTSQSLEGNGLVLDINRTDGGGQPEQEGASYNAIDCAIAQSDPNSSQDSSNDSSNTTDSSDTGETSESPLPTQIAQANATPSTTQDNSQTGVTVTPTPNTSTTEPEPSPAQTSNNSSGGSSTQASPTPTVSNTTQASPSPNTGTGTNTGSSTDSGSGSSTTGFGGINGADSNDTSSQSDSTTTDPNSGEISSDSLAQATNETTAQQTNTPSGSETEDSARSRKSSNDGTSSEQIALAPTPTALATYEETPSLQEVVTNPIQNVPKWFSGVFGRGERPQQLAQTPSGQEEGETQLSYISSDQRSGSRQLSGAQFTEPVKAQQSRPLVGAISVDTDKVLELSTEGWRERAKAFVWIIGSVVVLAVIRYTPGLIGKGIERLTSKKQTGEMIGSSLHDADEVTGQPLPSKNDAKTEASTVASNQAQSPNQVSEPAVQNANSDTAERLNKVETPQPQSQNSIPERQTPVAKTQDLGGPTKPAETAAPQTPQAVSPMTEKVESPAEVSPPGIEDATQISSAMPVASATEVPETSTPTSVEAQQSVNQATQKPHMGPSTPPAMNDTDPQPIPASMTGMVVTPPPTNQTVPNDPHKVHVPDRSQPLPPMQDKA